MTKEEKFWSRVEILGENDCWHWKKANGDYVWTYGSFKYNKKVSYAHKTAYELHHKIILPKSFPVTENSVLVCHSCDNPWCCNPNHLFLGTPSVNRNDCITKRRDIRTKWTEEKSFIYSLECV